MTQSDQEHADFEVQEATGAELETAIGETLGPQTDPMKLASRQRRYLIRRQIEDAFEERRFKQMFGDLEE